jgi:polysaccharide export outer membrane protein
MNYINTILCLHKNKLLIGISILLLTLLITACGIKEIPNINTQQVDSISENFYLRSGDEITVKHFNHPELTENVTIRPDGKISLQLIDDIIVEGLTPSELDTKLTKTFTDQLQNPELTIVVKDFKGQTIYISGEVYRPGEIIITGKLNALQAIFKSGGFKPDAKISEVVIISRGPDYKPVARKVNLKKALKGKLLENEYMLRPFDVVYIPKTSIAKIDDFTTHIYRIIPPRIWRGLSYEPGASFEINW